MNTNTKVFVPDSTKELLTCLSDPNVKKFLSLLSMADTNLIEVAKEYSKPTQKKNSIAFDSHGRKTGLKSDGKPIPHSADPIKDINTIKMIQEYFLNQNSIRDYTIFTLGICFGLRIGDLLSLHFYDVMENETTFKKYIQIHEDKTNKLNRITITDLAIQTIKKYINYLDHEYGGFRLNDYLFRSRKPRQTTDYDDEGQSPLTPARVHQILKLAAKDLNLNFNFSTHTLRKTFSYWALRLNEGDTEALYTLQSALNHSDPRTTLKYSGITQDNVDKMRGDVSSFFNGSNTESSSASTVKDNLEDNYVYIPEAVENNLVTPNYNDNSDFDEYEDDMSFDEDVVMMRLKQMDLLDDDEDDND